MHGQSISLILGVVRNVIASAGSAIVEEKGGGAAEPSDSCSVITK